MRNFEGYFFQDFPGLKFQFPALSRSWKFKEKIQDFKGGVGTLYMTIACELHCCEKLHVPLIRLQHMALYKFDLI